MDSILTYVGILALLLIASKVSFFLLSLVYRRCLARRFDVKRDSGGHWALVTGATDGIGKAYAFALAKRGMNLILVSRNRSKLEAVAAQIESEFGGVNVKVLEVDFVQMAASDFVPKIEEAVQGLDVGVLVNNVGMSYPHPDYFLSVSGQLIQDLVNCNIVSANWLTRILLPGMLQRKKGVVINISSLSGAVNSPLLTAYAGTKAYLDRFSQCLSTEYGDKGIVVQSILPGPVVSNMTKVRKASLGVPTPERFVESCLSRLGIESRTAGYWFHDILFALCPLLPSCIVDHVTMRVMMGIRAKALRKAQQEKRTQ